MPAPAPLLRLFSIARPRRPRAALMGGTCLAAAALCLAGPVWSAPGLAARLALLAGVLCVAFGLNGLGLLPERPRRREVPVPAGKQERDPLTGLANRHALSAALARLPREADHCAVLLGVDRLRQINDGRGHRSGDAVLLRLSQLLRQKLHAQRPSLPCGRWADNEFLLILPVSELSRAQATVQCVRSDFASLSVGGVSGMTLSAGIARRQEGEPVEDLLRRTELALHTAKQFGRDRIETAPDAPDRWRSGGSAEILPFRAARAGS